MKHYNSFILKLLNFYIVSAMLMLVGCTDSDDVGDNYRTFEGTTVKDYLDQHPEYSMFETALEKVGSLPLMSSYGKYTCFLPDNDAVTDYLSRKGYTSFDALLDTLPALRQMVYYHIIDGEASGAGNYLTTSFGIGNIETKNMAGRFLYTMPSEDGTTWMINNDARIIEANITMVNGVVHKVDRVIEGSDEVLVDFITNDNRFTLYARALELTALRDSLKLIEDESYEAPGLRNSENATYPQRRLYGYTALLEPDDVLKANGIETIDQMRQYAESKYPAGQGKADNDPQSALWQFVAYHLLPYKLTSSQIAPTRDFTVAHTFEDPEWQRETYRDGRFSLDNYLFPILPNTLIQVQKYVWRDQEEQTPIFNDTRNPYNPQWINMVSEAPGVVTIDMQNSNLDCLNGIVHSLTGILYYREDVYHKRIRMDFTTFFPEMWNNDLTFSGAGISAGNMGHAIPRGYLAKVSYEDKPDVVMNYWLRYGGHSYLFGDMFMMKGRCNVDIEIGPVPSGSYEVRIGYHPRAEGFVNAYGVVQYYLDGEPCGIPLDQSKNAKDPALGFVQSWFYLYGGIEQNPIRSDAWGLTGMTEDDYWGYENDKAMHNQGYMKAPDSYVSTELANGDLNPIHAGTARNDGYALRRVLKLVSWPTTTTHVLRISNLMERPFDVDYIEFVPTDLLEDEDTH